MANALLGLTDKVCVGEMMPDSRLLTNSLLAGVYQNMQQDVQKAGRICMCWQHDGGFQVADK